MKGGVIMVKKCLRPAILAAVCLPFLVLAVSCPLGFDPPKEQGGSIAIQLSPPPAKSLSHIQAALAPSEADLGQLSYT
jgi:hypothetical protein